MTARPELVKGRAVTNAVDNASLARHRWYPIKEGFSPNLVAESYRELGDDPHKKLLAIEPFSGSGTSPVECSRLGIKCIAFEVNPFLAFIGRTKLRQADTNKLRAQRDAVLKGLRYRWSQDWKEYRRFVKVTIGRNGCLTGMSCGLSLVGGRASKIARRRNVRFSAWR